MSTSVAHAETYNLVTKWGSFYSADGIAVDSSANVYVVDGGDMNICRILKFDSNGAFITKWGSYGSGNGQFNFPRGVAVDSSGNVYVADTSNQRIQKFDGNGEYLTQWGSYGSGNGQFYNPTGVAVDSSGNVYVADTYNHRIQKFDSNGEYLTQWGSQGSGNGQFNFPQGVAVDSSANVYVADEVNNRIQKFDGNGNFLIQWGSKGSADGQFSAPMYVAVDSSGNVYVADWDNHRIQKFDSNGEYLTQWGSYGIGNGQFSYPRGVAVDSYDNVYVADTGNGFIKKFSTKITPIITWNNPDDIIYGTALSSTQLNAAATDPSTGESISGTFAYTLSDRTPISIGTVLDLYTHPLHVVFTPEDTVKYNTFFKDATINVLPIITWLYADDIMYGTALSSDFLHANTLVPGTFEYTLADGTPAIGTVLSVGTHTLYVDFIPEDTVNYNTVSTEIPITVLSPPPIINSIVVPLDPVPIGTSITASASVTYLGDPNGIMFKRWFWGDGSIEDSSNFETSHMYDSAGIYTVTLYLFDGYVDTQKDSNFVVVYDPNEGFVTGGGWINSPPGAYISEPSLTDHANFGFVSKYQNGAKVPTGATEFNFNVADLNFHSENYDWLVVAGSQSKYKGTGTINGKGNYGFMLSAVDGAIKGDGIDKFRIKIWDKESGNTIYDNEIGTGEDAESSTAIGGGSIIIHKEK